MSLDPRSLFRSSPFHRWLDPEILRMDAEEVVLRIPFREEFVGDPEHSLYHGGILGAVVDAAGTFALIAATGRDWITVDMRIDYHRPAGPVELVARARPIRIGRRLGLAEVELEDDEGRTVASGRLSVAAVRAPGGEPGAGAGGEEDDPGANPGGG